MRTSARNQKPIHSLDSSHAYFSTGEILIILHTPSPHLVRISLVRFPLVRSFKKFQKYSPRADSSIGACTIWGISMRWIKRMNGFLISLTGSHTLLVASTSEGMSFREIWDEYSCHAFFNLGFFGIFDEFYYCLKFAYVFPQLPWKESGKKLLKNEEHFETSTIGNTFSRTRKDQWYHRNWQNYYCWTNLFCEFICVIGNQYITY